MKRKYIFKYKERLDDELSHLSFTKHGEMILDRKINYQDAIKYIKQTIISKSKKRNNGKVSFREFELTEVETII